MVQLVSLYYIYLSDWPKFDFSQYKTDLSWGEVVGQSWTYAICEPIKDGIKSAT